ncbi:MAG: hypothetical protein V1838_03950 [Patescibacteria group bacterium]
MPNKVHTVVMYPRPHPDPIVALFLLREFGAQQFPGIEEAKVEFWNRVPPDKTAERWEADGYILLDLGGGRFDHHQLGSDNKTDCAATLVAKFLGVEEKPELKKLLEFTRRDDLEGRGIVSKDIIDRAFGLSAITMNLNRDYPDHPDYVVEFVTRVVQAHYHEEYRRKVLMPKEWEELKRAGKAEGFVVKTAGRPVKVIMVQTDSKTLIGFLRALKDVQADIVVQRQSSGHTNFVTRQVKPRIDLKETVAELRKAEAAKKGNVDLSQTSREDLIKPHLLEGVEEWYYDTAANTIQNGGAANADITPTKLSLSEIKNILAKTLPSSLPPKREKREEGPRTISFADLKRRQ